MVLAIVTYAMTETLERFERINNQRSAPKYAVRLFLVQTGHREGGAAQMSLVIFLHL